MKGYLFISNSTKPSIKTLESLDSIELTSFSKASIWAANKMGWELHQGINRNHPEQIKSLNYDIKFYNQHTYRNIFALRDNWIAYRNLCNYLEENPQIEIIHCNTPIGGVIGRLAGRKYHKKVIYTAHGFHFFKGAPLFNRTILKWIEMWLAHYTDVLITINQEDFETAKSFILKDGGKIEYVPGVGVDTSTFGVTKSREEVLNSLSIPTNDFICVCMGDLVIRKNYALAIKAIALSKNQRIHYLICGEGPQKKELQWLAQQLGVSKQIHFLGFRTDIKDLLKASDCFLFSSLQEGLPRSTMEAMATGLPCIVSDIRGNRDLIDNSEGGYLCSLGNTNEWADRLNELSQNPSICQRMGRHNLLNVRELDIHEIEKKMYRIFKTLA